jgi:hypothetical protein
MTENDQIYKMLQKVADWCGKPKVFSGREAWLHGRSSMNRLEGYARELLSELYHGTMDDAARKALADGTHPVYEMSRKLGMDIAPINGDEK